MLCTQVKYEMEDGTRARIPLVLIECKGAKHYSLIEADRLRMAKMMVESPNTFITKNNKDLKDILIFGLLCSGTISPICCCV